MSSQQNTVVQIRIGKYELGRTLGEGTFAKVRLGRNVDTGECVAIKIMDKEKVLKHKMVEQVQPRDGAPYNLIQFFTGTCQEVVHQDLQHSSNR